MSVRVTAADIPEADLSTAEYPQQPAGHCFCDRIQVGAGGVSYSLALLGVNCSNCERYAVDCDWVDWWNTLARDERIAERVRDKNSAAEYEARRVAELAVEEPPF